MKYLILFKRGNNNEKSIKKAINIYSSLEELTTIENLQ